MARDSRQGRDYVSPRGQAPRRRSFVGGERASFAEAASNRRVYVGRGRRSADGQRGHAADSCAERSDSTSRAPEELIYGRHPVCEALRSGRPLSRLYVLAGASGLPSDIYTIARQNAIPIVHSDRIRLDHMVHGGNHQGVVALAATRTFDSLEEVLRVPAERQEVPLLLILDGVQDPGNFGALLRTAEGAGVHGVIVPSEGSCGFTPAVTRASAGADQYMKVARVPKLGALLRKLTEDGYQVLGADMGGAPYTECDMTGPTAIVMGAEGQGLGRVARELCTQVISLPLRGSVESLNVSAAGAIMMYEALRQRS